jgi:hypothetical protein
MPKIASETDSCQIKATRIKRRYKGTRARKEETFPSLLRVVRPSSMIEICLSVMLRHRVLSVPLSAEAERFWSQITFPCDFKREIKGKVKEGAHLSERGSDVR